MITVKGECMKCGAEVEIRIVSTAVRVGGPKGWRDEVMHQSIMPHDCKPEESN